MPGDVDELAAIVAEGVVGHRLEVDRAAHVLAVRLGMLAAERGGLVVAKVMADVEVEVAVAVEVGEGGRGRPVAVAAQPRGLGDLLERAIAPVPVERVRSPAGDEQVGQAVVVEVARRHAVAVAALERPDPGRARDVLEGAVAAVAEEVVAVAAGRTDRGERPPLDGEDVEPAVAVEVDQRHAAAHRLGQPRRPPRAVPVVVGEAEAGRLGIVGEPGRLRRLG